MIYSEKLINNTTGTPEDMSLDSIVTELRQKGYQIETGGAGNNITGISIPSTISIPVNGTTTITVNYDRDESGEDTSEDGYYAVVKGKYYLMELTNSGVKVARTASDISGSSNSDELTANSSDSCVTIGSISGNTITLNGGENKGTATITVNYGNYTKTSLANVVITPTETSVANATITFPTEYGTIDVIWLNTDNTIRSKPNEPNLTSNGEAMTPVTWTKSGDTWTENSGTWDNAEKKWNNEVDVNSKWYEYKAVSTREETGATTDNRTSEWANAKNTDGSYFVWIPRYAYRITYYSSATSTEPTGYYDGWGQWRASDGKVRLALDSGVETITHNGNKYIVHPAFTKDDDVIFKKDNNGNYLNETGEITTDPNEYVILKGAYDLGGWSKELSGFWVAKYEMSRNGATDSSAGSGYSTTFKSVPNVQSARSITIGNMYNVAKSYDTAKESHLMKNSEWGAVAYLTQSQYGRNGNEIDMNNSSSFITGNGGGSTSASSSDEKYAYNTTTGAKASTTGNIYGVYDMSSGAWEYVAVFNNTDTKNYESSNGSTFASTSGTSDKYATKYYNETTSSRGNARIYTYGKIGDATKEVNKGGAYALSNTSTYYNWFSDHLDLCYASNPFVARGGFRTEGASVGVFHLSSSSGGSAGGYSFRVVLCP